MDYQVLKDSPLNNDYTSVYFANDHRDLFDRLDAAFAAEEELVCGEDERVPFAVWAQMRLSLGWDGGHEHDERRLAVIRDVIDRMPDLPMETVKQVWGVADRLMTWAHTNIHELYRLPLAATARLPYHERRDVLNHRPRWLAQYWKPAWEVLREPIGTLLTEPETGDPAATVRNIMWEDDAFARRMIDAHAARLAAPEVLPLLRHWNTATASKPSARWLKRAAALLTPEADEVIRDVLRMVVTHREVTHRHQYRGGGEWTETVFLRERTAVPLRGMVWTCELVDQPWVTSLLGDVAVTTGTGIGGTGANARSEKLANAAIGVLGRRGGLEVVAQLARVQAKVRKKTILAGVARTIGAVAAQAGLSPEQLLERTVPGFGLGPDGVRTEQGLRLAADGTVTFTDPSGKIRKTIPKSVDRELLAEFRAAAKELRKTLPAERFRIERALATERVWRWRDVCEFYLDHPVTGTLARTLIWEIVQGPAGIPVRREDGWELTGPDGRRVQPGPDTPVRLWHPITHGVEEVRAWRDHLMDAGLRQPFKQAFREVYLLTPAEEASHDHSRRFAGHLLRYGTAKALLTERGWTGMSLGHWGWEYGSDQAEATRELPGGLAAHWDFHLDEHSFDRDGVGTVSICVSGNLRFTGADDRAVPLERVPPLVLSETLRDADLAVGVTSTGLDLQGDGDYWQSYSFGALSETARIRRDALTRLLPRLSIASRCELTERFLRVRGDLRTYKIHLGSGNILMEPDDAYLCIVPGGVGDQVFLPFEEDGGMLSVVLSKAFLLAADTAIADPAITRQLTNRRPS
ncbi:DUF4132 domain-containing protein [Nonomuraea harbinensis]|uniref:DUF4132 domain-containing protein n=1 Tax=Nonomuraea harbinensis TaxID=1286938 RepID=A0ABW1C221_9ACTN|nr:DUF4132 domain-containing protein [Nonomuraea harbinensis]